MGGGSDGGRGRRGRRCSASSASSSSGTRFWTKDPAVLVRQWYEIVPYGRMSSARKANALSRLALLVGGVLLANRAAGNDGGTAVLVCIALFATVVAVILLVQRRERSSRAGQGRGGDGRDDGTASAYRVEGFDYIDDSYPLITYDDYDDDRFYDADDRAYVHGTADVRQQPSDADLAWLTGGAGGRTHTFDDEDTSLVLPSRRAPVSPADVIDSGVPLPSDTYP